MKRIDVRDPFIVFRLFTLGLTSSHWSSFVDLVKFVVKEFHRASNFRRFRVFRGKKIHH